MLMFLVNIQRTSWAVRRIAILAGWLLLTVDAVLGDELDRPVVARQAVRESATNSDDVATIVLALRQANGATDEREVAKHLEALRVIGVKASNVAESVAELLNESSPLYRDRDKHEVMRLRAYVFVVLSEVGIPSSALPLIVDALANSDDEMGYYFAAAARAAGSLGPRARPLIPHLCAGMQRYYHRDEFSLERYNPNYPQEEATTVQAEAITALSQISATSNKAVVELLNSYANGTHPDTRRFPTLIKHAERSLRLMESRGTQHTAASTELRAGPELVTEAESRSQK
jgi:hypothetical protein